MTDLRLAVTPDGPDLLFAGDLVRDEGLTTAVLISLFTDRRAEDSDAVDDGDRRGYWGDAYSVTPWGSRLWMLSREKQTPAAVRRARDYAEEALAWLVTDRIASSVRVVVSVPRDGMLALEVFISRPGRPDLELRFERLWAALAATESA